MYSNNTVDGGGVGRDTRRGASVGPPHQPVTYVSVEASGSAALELHSRRPEHNLRRDGLSLPSAGIVMVVLRRSIDDGGVVRKRDMRIHRNAMHYELDVAAHEKLRSFKLALISLKGLCVGLHRRQAVCRSRAPEACFQPPTSP